MLTLCLTIVVLLGYGLSVWGFLRRESRSTCLFLAGLVGIALVLRLIYPHDYPPGYNPDEPKRFQSSVRARLADDPISPGYDAVSNLFSALFSAPLLPLEPYVGGRFVVRGYSIAAGALSVALLYTFCRALELGVTASLVGAALLVVLPWSLFYSRVTAASELILHELILGTALARLIWDSKAGWREGCAGAFGLTLLLYDYWAGQVLLVWPLLTLPFLRSRSAAFWCIGITLVAGLAWLPWWRVSPDQWVQWEALWSGAAPQATWHRVPDLWSDPFRIIAHRFAQFGACLVHPVAHWSIWTQPAVLVHPPVVLAAAALGVWYPPIRRTVFLLLSCALAALPAILTSDLSIHGHRVLLALPFIAVAATCAIEAVPHRAQSVVAVLFATLAAEQSVTFFFSTTFWPPIIVTSFPFPY
jgi:hypothetical protein